MAADGKRRKPESAGYRIWPGVTLIAVCAFAFFLLVYVIAYRSDLIPLPEYIEMFLRKNEETAAGDVSRDEVLAGVYPAGESDTLQIFSPEQEDAVAMFAALDMPQQYYQRMQITEYSDTARKSRTADIYRKESCWKLILQEKNSGQTKQYLSDGTEILRTGEKWLLDGTIMAVGQFTPENQIGIPTLQELQSMDNLTVTYLPDEKNLQFSGEDRTGIQCSGKIALDTGLLMDLRMQKDGVTFLSIYTVLFDMFPAEYRQEDFFTLSDNGGNEQ